MKKSTKLSAFTLIELLIVIAIIGILAGLMSGAIANVMSGANATKIGNNGRNIINALMQTNQDREAAALSALWPKTSGKLLKEDFSDANGYFSILMKKDMLSGISLPDFAGAGVSAADSAEKLATESKNIWCTLGGIGSCGSYTPIFWTRNLNTDSDIKEDDFGSADPEDAKQWADKLVAKATPFGGELVVVIRKGGAMQVIKSKQLSDYTFLAGATNDTSAIKIWNAIDTGKEATDED